MSVKRIVYAVIALAAVAMATVSFPLINVAHAEESPLSYAELTDYQLEAFRIMAEVEINGYVDEDNKTLTYGNEQILIDFNNNEYILYTFSPCGYSIYSMINFDAIEIAPFSVSPYNGCSGNLYYVPTVGYFESVDSQTIIDIHNGNTIKMSETEFDKIENTTMRVEKSIKENINANNKMTIISAEKGVPKDLIEKAEYTTNTELKNESKSRMSQIGGSDSNASLNNGLVQADHEVKYSWYFKYCDTKNEIGYSDGDICGYIALGMLICYHDIFSSYGYFTEIERNFYITTREGPYGQTVPLIDPVLATDLKGSRGNGTIAKDVRNAFDDFMVNKDIEYDNWENYLGFGSLRQQIDKSSPTIMFGNLNDFNGGRCNHAVIVYGYYNDGRLLTHYGWAGYSQVILSNYIIGSFYGIENKSQHKHRKRYFKNGSFEYCGCGEIMAC